MIGRFPSLLHFQASALLKNALSQTGEALRTAAADQIANNQVALDAALEAARRPFPGRTALVDAHSVIDNDEALVPLPVEIFARLRPDAICFLKAAPDEVLRRRQSDGRERPARTLEQIDAYQRYAEEVARSHAHSMDVPFLAVDSQDVNPLAALIEEISNR